MTVKALAGAPASIGGVMSVLPAPLATLAVAPHRVLFLPGAAQGVLVMFWWLLELAARGGGLPLPPADALPGTAAHVWLMVYGLFPFFVFGFLFTAVPSWLDAPRPTRPAYLAVALPMALGALLFYPGLYLPGLAMLAVALHLAGWAAALRILWRMLAHRPAPSLPARQAVGLGVAIQTAPAESTDRRHARAALLACALGAAGELAFLAWLLADAPLAFVLAESLGVWGFLAPVFLAVCHRMLPWFTSRVVKDYAMVRPTAALVGMLAACLAHAALEVADLRRWLWLADLPLAGLLLWLAYRWRAAAAWRVRLLAMLHAAFPWAGLACALYAADSLARLLGAGWDLGHAPLHALGIGFFASMLLAMASRVSLGHSGGKLEADGLTWALFWLVQATAVARVVPDLIAVPHAAAWMSLASLAWLAAFAPWAWRYAPLFWRPRVDGKPG